MVKTCTKCGLEKSIADFHRSNATSDGIRTHCKECRISENSRNNPRRNEALKNRFPSPDKAVYAFLDGKEIIYIGESHMASRRIAMHYGDKSVCFCPEINPLERKKRFSYAILWYGDSDSDRKSQEKELIKLHQPKFNKTHK